MIAGTPLSRTLLRANKIRGSMPPYGTIRSIDRHHTDRPAGHPRTAATAFTSTQVARDAGRHCGTPKSAFTDRGDDLALRC